MKALIRNTGRIMSAALAAQALLPVSPAQAQQDQVVPCDTSALIAAINAVNAAGGGTITLTSACDYVLTEPASTGASGPNGLPIITAAVTIIGDGTQISRASDAPRFRILEVATSGLVKLISLTVRGGDAGANSGGGILLSQGGLGLRTSTVQDNTAARGGGIANAGGRLTLVDTVVEGNRATATVNLTSTGPVISTSADTVHRIRRTPAKRSHIDPAPMAGRTPHHKRGGKARGLAAVPAGHGGGILNAGELKTIRGRIGSNEALVGGGVANEKGGTATFRNTTISGNTAGKRGGGVYNGPGGTSRVISASISQNTANGTGGGLYNGYISGAVRLSGSTVAENTADNCAPSGSIAGCPR